MITRDGFFAWLASDTGKAVIAGALGGLVRWITLRSDWREGFGALAVGAVCALYLGPIVQPLLEPTFGAIAPDGDAAGFSSFIVGLGGIGIAGILLDVVRGFGRGRSDDEK